MKLLKIGAGLWQDKIFVRTKMFDFSNYLPNLKYCDDPKEFVVGKMKSETDGVAIELGLKP